ncbi:hypothetical protein [Mycolicibacterium goodii]|nr:hypothetical protein [Mycolicibacterium goodii]PJK19706.1 hypothetical protein CSX11_25200 [Mycolicibacterium goodii]
MTPAAVMLVVLTAVGLSLAAWGLHDLQAWLERWAYDRHAQD